MPPVKRAIKAALKRVNAEITGLSRGESIYAAGLASEGYSGGYRDALNDITLLLNGVLPERRDYWRIEDLPGYQIRSSNKGDGEND